MGNDKWPRKIISGSITVKVYRVKHATAASGFAYVVAHSGPLGRKLDKFADPAEALVEARLKADQLSAGRVEGGSMTRGDRDELQAIRKICGDTPPLTALGEWRKVRDLTQGNPLAAAQAWAARNSSAYERIAVADAVKDFLAAKEKSGVDTASSYKKILPTLGAKFAERLLDTISARELQGWMHERYPHPVTFNTARKRFVSLWRWCRKKGHLPRDVQTEAEQLDSAREEHAQIGVINAATFANLLEHFRALHPEYLAPLVVAGFCGLRRSEIHEQSWEDIAVDRNILRVTKAKRNTPARRIVPLSAAAVEWLLLCGDRKDLLCSNLAIDRIRDIGRAAGFKLPENCFRHSYISHRVAQTGNVAETSLESGNSPAIIFRRYRELFAKAEGEAWFCVRPGTTNGKVIAYA